jgi:hypothetical protein
MQKKENQIAHFLTIGIVELLWGVSQVSIFLFIFPTWLCVFTQIAFVIGRSIPDLAFATGFYCIGSLCFLLMLGSLWFGFRAAQGFCRIIALIQCGLALLFSFILTIKNAFNLLGPFDFDSVETIVTIFIMFVLFIVTVLSDTARAFREQRAME